MGFFGRESHEQHQGWRAETALVLYGEAPLEHAPSFGKGSHRSIGLLLTAGGGSRQVIVQAKHQADQWLVPGMTVSVLVDPADGEHVAINWDDLPGIEDRVAAGDPVLIDPIGAEETVARARGLPVSARRGRLQQALAAAAAAPVGPGGRRAVVMVATIRGRAWMDQGTHSTSYRNDSAAVLSVNVPGQAPYAVFKAKFKCPRGKEAAVSQELPAIVAGSDPGEIEILWAEVASDLAFGAAEVAGRLAEPQAPAAAFPAAAAGPPGAGFPAAAFGRFDPEAIARQRKASIQAMLARVEDPASRKAMIDQYRAMGIDIDDAL